MRDKTQRIRTDVTLLAGIISLTFVLCLFPRLYLTAPLLDRWLDFGGFLLILDGTLWRMGARGHKKSQSPDGWTLMTDGLFGLVRNPMYFGSFLLGAGFVLIVWPWWLLPIFTFVFYKRFKEQITKEEAYLEGLFGEPYTQYCKDIPRFFPDFRRFKEVNLREAFSFDEIWITQEKNGLLIWPTLAMALETLQEKYLFHRFDPLDTVTTCLLAIAMYAGFLWFALRTVKNG